MVRRFANVDSNATPAVSATLRRSSGMLRDAAAAISLSWRISNGCDVEVIVRQYPDPCLVAAGRK